MGGGEDRAARASVETGSSLATCFQGWIISLFIKRPECTDVFTEEAMAALVPQEVEAE
jgi:stage III sporulation protein SpoIIIAA